MTTRRLWLAFAGVIAASFLILGYAGLRIYQQAPPVPDRIVTDSGRDVVQPGDIAAGQNVWQSMGGMEVGSIWGHGSYLAPDWTADWLHREAMFILDRWSREESAGTYDARDAESQARLRQRLTTLMRANAYDPTSRTITIGSARAAAFDANAMHYADVFASGREEYAVPSGALTDLVKQRQLAAFFFWTAWAASTNRPGDTDA